jgi:GT2 family glycosyltransferase
LELSVQILTNVLGPAAARVLASFPHTASPGAVNAVTGDSAKDRMLVETSFRLADALGVRDRLGDSVFLHLLALRKSNLGGTRYHVGYLPGEAHFLAFLGAAGNEGRIVLRLPEVGDRELLLQPGDVISLPAGANWLLPHQGDETARWLQFGYKRGSVLLSDAPDGANTGIRLWGPSAGPAWKDLSLPNRGPNGAFVLPVTALPVNPSVPGDILAGRTDTLNDVRLRLAHGPTTVASPLHERLVLPLGGGTAAFSSCLDEALAQATSEAPALILEWVGSPRIGIGDALASDGPIPTQTAYLSQLAVHHQSMSSGEEHRIEIAMGDHLLVLRRGKVAVGGEVLEAPACIFVPTGSVASLSIVQDAELVQVFLGGLNVDLAPQQLPSAGARVAFCIPLGPREHSPDWGLAQRLLETTLLSLLRQTDPNWIAVVVGTDTPELHVPADDRVHYLSITSDTTDGGRAAALQDSVRKRRLAEKRARELGADYVCFLDSDDLMHPDLVQYIRQTQHPYGYAMGSGYIVDYEGADLAPYPVWGGGASLDEISASTVVFSCQTLPEILGNIELQSAGHVRYRLHMHRLGRPLMEVPFRASTYVRFTATNLSYTRFAASARASAFEQLRLTIARNSVRDDVALLEHLGVDQLFAKESQTEGLPGVFAKHLSILVCTHRRPGGLAALLAGLVPQIAGHEDREIIVVNDGTHDSDYSSVIGQYGTAVRYLPLQSGVGIAEARTRAAELARGEYLLFTDDDCEVPPSWVDWVDATLKCEPEVDVVAGYTRPLRLETAGFVGRVQAAFDLLPRPYVLSDTEIIFVTACLAIRKRSFQRVGGFATGSSFAVAAEDTELALRLGRNGARMRVDEDWHVFHQLATSAQSELRRFRRYGYGNRKLAEMPGRPHANQFLRHLRRRDMPGRFVQHFRDNALEADNLKAGRLTRFAGRVLAALMITAYDYGAASNRPG